MNDLAGQAFGRLTAIRPIAQATNRAFIWACVCVCGNLVDVRGDSLRTGNTQSCGCLQKERAGGVWQGDSIGYRGAHNRIVNARGSASRYACVDCGTPARDWAIRRGMEKLVEGSLRYSPEPNDYDPRCRPCHKRYDKGE